MFYISVLVGFPICLSLLKLYGFRVFFLGATLGAAGFIFGSFHGPVFAVILELLALVVWLFAAAKNHDDLQEPYNVRISPFVAEKWGVEFQILLTYRVEGDPTKLLQRRLNQAYWKDRVDHFRIPPFDAESMARFIKTRLEEIFQLASKDTDEDRTRIILLLVEVMPIHHSHSEAVWIRQEQAEDP